MRHLFEKVSVVSPGKKDFHTRQLIPISVVVNKLALSRIY